MASTHQAHRYRLGVRHAQAFGDQVGKQDEERGNQQERTEKSEGLRGCLGQPARKKGAKARAQGALAHDTAQDRHRVLPDLYHGEVVARLLLQAQDAFGACVAIVGQLAQPQAP